MSKDEEFISLPPGVDFRDIKDTRYWLKLLAVVMLVLTPQLDEKRK